METSRFVKFAKIIIPILFMLAAALGFYQWQFNNGTIKDILWQPTSNNSFEDYFNTGKNLSPQNTTTEISFFAVGDIMLSRNVAGQIAKNQKDPYWPFRSLENLLLTTDFNFGNLESPFTGRDDYNPSGSLVFNAPTWTLPGLIQHNFKVLNIANNHAMDQGLEGLLYTKKVLEENRSVVMGGGKNLDEAWRGAVYSVKGVRVGFVGASYTSLNDGGVATNNYVARMEDVDRLKASIAELKTRSDFIVVTMHAGTEYIRNPNQIQIDFARAAIDYGADIVIGAHPHWVQTTEQYKGKYIFYSLGNFIFDQEWSQDTKEGLMLKVSITKNGNCATNPTASPSGQQQVTCGDAIQGSSTGAKLKHIELVPIIIENYGQPRLATGAEKANILKKIGVTNSLITP